MSKATAPAEKTGGRYKFKGKAKEPAGRRRSENR
jgi:hypothetical protein